MTKLNLQHWRLDVDAEGITWAILDKAGESANSLSRAVMDELGQVLDECEHQPPKALIFSSGKSAGFIAGADIQEFTQLDSAERRKRARTGRARLESLQPPGCRTLPDAGAGSRSLPRRRPRTGAGMPLPAGS